MSCLTSALMRPVRSRKCFRLIIAASSLMACANKVVLPRYVAVRRYLKSGNIGIKAANAFKDKTTAINQLWQTGFTYIKGLGWSRFYLNTVGRRSQRDTVITQTWSPLSDDTKLDAYPTAPQRQSICYSAFRVQKSRRPKGDALTLRKFLKRQYIENSEIFLGSNKLSSLGVLT